MPLSDSDAFYILNADSPSSLILTVDHASRHIPAEYDNLGVRDPSVLHRHIAWDIGIEDVSKRLAEKLGASAIFAGFSRLLVDANRYPDNPAVMPERSDGVDIPGNVNLNAAERQRRLDQWFTPYHAALGALVDNKQQQHEHPLLISMHSFTPVMNEFERPWHIGVLWDDDPRLALPLLRILRENSALVVGDNEPYSAREPLGYTMNEHGMKRGIANVAIEIRQDLIDTHQGAGKWAAIMADAIQRLKPIGPPGA